MVERVDSPRPTTRSGDRIDPASGESRLWNNSARTQDREGDACPDSVRQTESWAAALIPCPRHQVLRAAHPHLGHLDSGEQPC